MNEIKRYSRQDLNDMKVTKQDRRYVDYFEAKSVVDTMQKRIDELEQYMKEFCDLLVSPYDYSDREYDEIIEKAKEYLGNSKV